MDTLDGRVARLTNTQSAFGASYDSLIDIVSFGIAPSVLVYCWGLNKLGLLGLIISAFYIVTTALRLARFNTTLELSDGRYFQGLPCTLAPGFLTSLIYAITQSNVDVEQSLALAATITALVGLLMVSNVKHYSFKTFDFKKHVIFVLSFIFIIILDSIYFGPALMLCGVFSLYIGVNLILINRLKSLSK